MLDLRPEFCQYRDKGCQLFPSCLSCPLPCCVHDEPRGSQRQLKALRNRQVLHLHQAQGLSISELARCFRLSQRTVYRILSRAKSEETIVGGPERSKEDE